MVKSSGEGGAQRLVAIRVGLGRRAARSKFRSSGRGVHSTFEDGVRNESAGGKSYHRQTQGSSSGVWALAPSRVRHRGAELGCHCDESILVVGARVDIALAAWMPGPLSSMQI